MRYICDRNSLAYGQVDLLVRIDQPPYLKTYRFQFNRDRSKTHDRQRLRGLLELPFDPNQAIAGGTFGDAFGDGTGALPAI